MNLKKQPLICTMSPPHPPDAIKPRDGSRGQVAAGAAHAQAIVARATGIPDEAERGQCRRCYRKHVHRCRCFVHPPRQLEGDATASIASSDGPSSAAGTTAMTAAMVHVCGHCQKRFRSPSKLAQHERVHTSRSRDHMECRLFLVFAIEKCVLSALFSC